MANAEQGGRLSFSANRALVLDGCRIAKRIPFFPVERLCDLSAVDRLRKEIAPRISWSVMFLKAYALVAQRHAPLRRSCIEWPWLHPYEHPHSVGMLAINREHQAEDRLCWGRFIRPDQISLVDLQRALDGYLADPVEKAFKRQVLLSRLPQPLRRLVWWINLHVAVGYRARRLGTFSMSSLAGQGATNRMHFSVLSTSLSYGPLDDEGRSLVTLICDHRVIDGLVAAQALEELEQTLNGAICDELKTLGAKSQAA